MSDHPPQEPAARLRTLLPPLGAALSLSVIFLAALSIPLDAAVGLGLTGPQITGWIVALYGVSGLISFGLIFRYRQPLLMTGNIFVLIFIASLAGELAWPELVGASMLAGAVVLVSGPLGLSERLAAWLPAPIVYGLLAGAVLDLVIDLFSALGDQRMLVGLILGSYLVGQRVFGGRVPPILPALVVGVVVAGLAGQLGALPETLTWPAPAVTAPVFSLTAILTATPVMVVLIALQANVPSLVYLRSQRYAPPERTVTVVSGAATLFGSMLGPMGVSLSLPATALCAGPDAGEQPRRYRAAAMAAAAAVVIALLGGFAAELPAIIPAALIDAVVGLAVLGVLTAAIQRVAQGPLVLGPLFAFAVSLSDLTLFGLGRFFWALVLGLATSLLTEGEKWPGRGEAAAS